MVLWRQVMKSHYLFIRRRYGILILILLLERKKAGSSIPGTSLLDCLKNGRFRYVPLSDEMPEDRFSVGIWVWQ